VLVVLSNRGIARALERAREKLAGDNTPVRFEFVFNSNDSVKTKITNKEINEYELKLK